MTHRTEHRPQMPVEDFEELALRAPETVWLEFIGGRLTVKGEPDGNRSEIIAGLQRLWAGRAGGPWLYAHRGLRTEADEQGRTRPDGVLAPARHFAGHGEWSPAAGALMTVEVTTNAPDTDRHTRTDKPHAYAAAGIPVHLLVDRDDRSVLVSSRPENGCYRREEKLPFGAPVKIPAPVDIVLDTAPFEEYAN